MSSVVSFNSLLDCFKVLSDKSSLYPFRARLAAANMVAALKSMRGLRLVKAHMSSGVPLDLPSADFS